MITLHLCSKGLLSLEEDGGSVCETTWLLDPYKAGCGALYGCGTCCSKLVDPSYQTYAQDTRADTHVHLIPLHRQKLSSGDLRRPLRVIR